MLSAGAVRGLSCWKRLTSAHGMEQMNTALPLHWMMPRSSMVRVPGGSGCPITAPRLRKRLCSAATHALPVGPALSVAPLTGVVAAARAASASSATLCRSPHSRVCPPGHQWQQEVCLGLSALRPQRKEQPRGCLSPHCAVWEDGQHRQQVWKSGALASLPHCMSHPRASGLVRASGSGSSDRRSSLAIAPGSQGAWSAALSYLRAIVLGRSRYECRVVHLGLFAPYPGGNRRVP